MLFSIFQNKYNPFYYFRIDELLIGNIGIGFKGAIIILILFIIILNILSYRELIKDKDNLY